MNVTVNNRKRGGSTVVIEPSMDKTVIAYNKYFMLGLLFLLLKTLEVMLLTFITIWILMALNKASNTPHILSEDDTYYYYSTGLVPFSDEMTDVL